MANGKSSPPVSLILSILVSTVLAVAGLFWVHRLGPAGWFQANNDVAGSYLQTIGTLYAVLLAFVVFVVWQQHNDARESVENEANELSDLHRILQAFPETLWEPAATGLRAYQRAVVEEEWTAMGKGQASPQAEQALEDLWRAIAPIAPRTSQEEALYAEALARFNDLSDARTHRLYCGHLRLPPSLWALILTNGALLVGSMWLFGLESFGAHALMTAALAGSIAFIVYLIADLDNPFWGAWQVTSDPIGQALNRRGAGRRPPAA